MTIVKLIASANLEPSDDTAPAAQVPDIYFFAIAEAGTPRLERVSIVPDEHKRLVSKVRMAMAMTMGEAKGGPACEMNVTPLIDVLLTLIIVFMILSTQVKSMGLDALAPHPAENPGTIPPERTVVVQVLQSSNDRPDLLINREPVTWEGLSARLLEIYKLRAERVLFVQADAESRFEYVAGVIDVARGEFKDMRVGLLTQKIGN